MSSAVNQRLHKLIAHVHPEAHALHEKTGQWPTRPGGDPQNPEHGQAPFAIITRPTDMAVKLTTADGDTITGAGPDVDGAITALAAKLKVEV